jgi:hypothetical protein
MTAPASEARAPRRIFFSGHSLMDMPVPADVAQIAAGRQLPLQWQRQYMVGSSIRMRSRGADPDAKDWPGYGQGIDRDGQPIDVLQELRQPRALGPGERYDTLVIAEGTGVLGSLLYTDTLRYLRHYHDRFIEAQGQGQTYLYQPWSSLGQKQDIPAWIAFERQTSRAWQCAVARINRSLEHEGRADRIASLPANLALAELIAEATTGAGLPGLSAETPRATVDRLIHDDIHSTRLGAYYMALVSFASIFKRSPEGAWVPPEVSPAQAKTLQSAAWRHVSRFYATPPDTDLQRCREFIRGEFCATYWKKEGGKAHGGLRAIKLSLACRYRFWRENDSNPLHFDPASDARYWLPPV